MRPFCITECVRWLWDDCMTMNLFQVSFYMPDRTKEQCYQRWTLSAKNGIRRGHFDANEDSIIIIAAKLFGKNWAKISEFVPYRGPAQVHSRQACSSLLSLLASKINEDMAQSYVFLVPKRSDLSRLFKHSISC